MDDARARELLSAERSRIEALLGEQHGERRDAETGDGLAFNDDGAEPLTEEAGASAVIAQLQDGLAALDRAEARLAAGTYGRSVRSGEVIPDARLEAEPTAELTVEEAAEAANPPAV